MPSPRAATANASATAYLRPAKWQPGRSQQTMQAENHRGHDLTVLHGPSSPMAMRLPSARPIDQRWDASRGIVFARARRAHMQEVSPTPNYGIVVGARSYARRIIGSDLREALHDPNRLPSTNQTLNDAHTHQLLKAKDELDRQLEKVQAKLAVAEQQLELSLRKEQEQRDRVMTLENKMASMTQDYETQNITAQEQLKVRQHEYEVGLGQVTAELAMTKEKLTTLESQTASERQAEVDAEISMRVPREVNAAKEDIRQEERQGYLARVQDLEARAAAAVQERSLLDNVSVENASLRTDLAAVTARHVEELKDQNAFLEARVNAEAEAFREGQRHRRDVMRKDYDSFRSLWNGVQDAQYAISKTLTLAAQRFEGSNPQISFVQDMKRHIPDFAMRYESIVRKINHLVVKKGHKDRKSASVLRKALARSQKAKDQVESHAHRMRLLINYLRYEPTRPTSRAVGLEYYELMRPEWQRLYMTVRAQIEAVEGELMHLGRSKSSRSTQARVQYHNQLRDLKLHEFMLNVAREYHAYTERKLSYEALRVDSLAQKKVNVQMFDVSKRLRISENWIPRSGSSDIPLGVSAKESLGALMYGARAEADDVARELRKTIWKRAALETSSGVLQQEEKDLDQGIDAELERIESRMKQNVARLAEMVRQIQAPVDRTGVASAPQSTKSSGRSKGGIATSLRTARASSRPRNRAARPKRNEYRLALRPSSRMPAAHPVGALQYLDFCDDVGRHRRLLPPDPPESITVMTAHTGDYNLSPPVSEGALARADIAAGDSSRPGNDTYDNRNDNEMHATQDSLRTTAARYEPRGQSDSHEGGAASIPIDFADAAPADGKHQLVNQPLAFQISPDARRKAAMASTNVSAAYWSYKLYNNSAGQCPSLHYCINIKQAEQQLQPLLGQKVLGFDLEWEVPNWPNAGIKRNISLLQIASEDRIVLIHFGVFSGNDAEDMVSPTLRAILESEAIVKAGVNIFGDAKRVLKYLGIRPRGIFELSHLYRVVRAAEGEPGNVTRRLCALADQVERILLMPLYKGDVRQSAWSRRLRPQQVEYAASDAYAGLRLYQELELRRQKCNPCPPLPAFAETRGPLVFADGTVKASTSRIVAGARRVPRDEDDAEEFFDAVEEQDALPLHAVEVAGVLLAGLHVSYPSLPPLSDYETASYAQVIDAPAAKDKIGGSSQNTGARPPKLDHVGLAERWIDTWRSSSSTDRAPRLGSATLKAYHLWHEQGLSIEKVASLSRDPPLQTQTVASYILQAIKEEELPFDADRVKAAFLCIPRSVHGRYQKVLDRIGEGL